MTTGNRLHGPLDDVSGDAGYGDGHPQRVGFFTDTSVCIGCKACEVACKEWNGLPDPESDALVLTGMSYDNTGALGASSWRHVAFIEQAVPPASALSRDDNGDLIISASLDGAVDGAVDGACEGCVGGWVGVGAIDDGSADGLGGEAVVVWLERSAAAASAAVTNRASATTVATTASRRPLRGGWGGTAGPAGGGSVGGSPPRGP